MIAGVQFESMDGRMYMNVVSFENLLGYDNWQYGSSTLDPVYFTRRSHVRGTEFLGFSVATKSLRIPYWFPAILFAALSVVAVRSSFKFNMRALLIASTFVALVFGAAVTAIRYSG
jgi:hypothetical protein